MKKISVVVAALLGCLVMVGQTNINVAEPTDSLSIGSDPVSAKSSTAQRGEEIPLNIYWQEDFSNGFNGMPGNGTWTTDGPQGDLWFYTFPRNSGLPGAYDPAEFNPGYSTLPNYFGDRETIDSETNMNGFMMIDADAYNSLTVQFDDPQPSTENLIDSYLVSPMINLTGITSGHIQFTQSVRLCCANVSYVAVELSTNGGANWTEFDVFTDYTEVNETIYAISVEIDITPQLEVATDLSEVQIRFHFPSNATDSSGTWVYYWMLDDIIITSLMENELEIGEVYYGEHILIKDEWVDAVNNNEADQATAVVERDYIKGFQYAQQPAWSVQPFNFSAEVTNNGALVQTGVYITVDFEDPAGLITEYSSEDNPLSIAVGETTLVTIEEIMPPAWEAGITGEYKMLNWEVHTAEGIEDQSPENNNNYDILTTEINNDYMTNGLIYSSIFLGEGFWPYNLSWGTRYVFTENTETPKFITHIEFVLRGADGPTPTAIGAQVQLNIRYGSIFTEENSLTNDLSYAFDENEQSLNYTIEENDLSGATAVWISVPLPQSIEIEADLIYQPEVRIANEPSQPVFVGFSNGQEVGAGVLRDYFDELGEDGTPTPNGYYTIGNYNPMMRFRVSDTPLSLSEITANNGVQLFQNWPNPTSEETTFKFSLEKSEDVTFEMYDITGKLVVTESLGNRPAGVTSHAVSSKGLSEGIYSYSIVTADARVTKKLVVIK